MSSEHWKGTRAYAQLPATVHGKITAWGHGGKEGGKISVDWESDGKNSAGESLCVLLQKRLEFKLLPYADGKSAPKAKGSTSKRAYHIAVTTGPYADAVAKRRT